MTNRKSTPHAVVVGAGLGGMAAAIRLRGRGYRVTLVEANEQLGGRASVFKQDGYIFDAGPTVVTAPYLFDEVFESVGRKTTDYFETVPVDPFYRVDFADGSQFDYVGEEDRILSQIEQFNMRDVDGYRRMADHARRIFEIGYQELAHVPFDKLNEMLRIIPTMIKLENYRSVYGLVSKYIKDERLRQVFTFQPLLIGGNPFNCSSIYMLIHWLERKWGVHYAKGGTTAIVNAMGQVMNEVGIDVRLNSPVTEISVDNRKARSVRLDSGAVIDCDLVVCNADPSVVYTKLVASKHRRYNTDFVVGLKKQSMSLFVVYFGTKKQYPDLKHHTIVLGPRYKHLLNDIFNKKVLADDFSLYLHAPTRSDSSVAPEGHECLYVLSPVPNQRSGIDWDSCHEAYRNRIFEVLEERCMPGLRENLTTVKSVDPRYFEGRLRSYDGAAFGLEPRLTQSAYFRYHNRSRDVHGLYFVGSGVHPGAGMPGVLCSAKVLDRVVPDLTDAERAPVPLARRVA